MEDLRVNRRQLAARFWDLGSTLNPYENEEDYNTEYESED